MRKILALLLTILLPILAIAQQPPASSQPLALRHVTLIDMTGSPPQLEMTVLVNDNRITALGKSGKIKVPPGVRVIDARGKYLIPGLWDMHVHSLTDRRYEWVFPLLIANGVTGVRDMGSNLSLEETNRIRREILDGEMLGPRLGAAAGSVFDGAGTRLNIAVEVKNADQAQQLVRDYKQKGADFIKPYNLLSREVYLALVDEAKRQKIPIAGHVPFSMTAAEVSDLGQVSVEHNTDVLLSCSGDEEKLRKELAEALKAVTEGVLGRFDAKAAATYDERKAAVLFQRFVHNHTWSCPTLVVNRPVNLIPDESIFLSDSRLKYVPQPMR